MELIQQALRAGGEAGAAPPLLALQNALVVGAGGVLGSALLGEALAGGRFQRVAAVTTGTLASAMRGFQTVPHSALQTPAAWRADVAFVVFERARHSNGRDEAFLQPQPADLPALARALHGGGVRRLVVVVPHAPALLPHALKAGFASRDEADVAALGFEQLLFIRAAQDAFSRPAGAWLARFAAWWLAQLRWMVPQREQPVRAVKLAALAVQLARLLPAATPGTRVVPPELLWQASQADSAAAEALLARWLGHR
jgi:hypothetical protein